MPLLEALAIGQGLIGAGQAVAGLIDKGKAKRELASLKSPFYKIQEELLQNRDIAAQQAQLGVPQEVKDYLTTETQRGLGTSLMAANNQRLGANSIAELFDRYQRGVQSNAAQQAQMTAAQINRFMEANTAVAGQKIMQWTINEFNPYQNRIKNLQARIAQNNATIGSGISNLLSAGATYLVGKQNEGLLDALTKGGVTGAGLQSNGNTSAAGLNAMVGLGNTPFNATNPQLPATPALTEEQKQALIQLIQNLNG
jgi:hypothetical protein